MATFSQLKLFSENMFLIKKKDLLSYHIDSFAEHLPKNVSKANDDFVAANKDITD